MIDHSQAQALLASLTSKQIEVLDLLVRHQTTKDIARALDLAPSTVDQRIAAVRDKWATADRKATARRYAEILAVLGSDGDTLGTIDLVPDDDVAGPVIANAPQPASAPLRNSAHPLLEGLDERYGALGRITLIAIAALSLALVLATSLGVANALGTLIRGY